MSERLWLVDKDGEKILLATAFGGGWSIFHSLGKLDEWLDGRDMEGATGGYTTLKLRDEKTVDIPDGESLPKNYLDILDQMFKEIRPGEWIVGIEGGKHRRSSLKMVCDTKISEEAAEHLHAMTKLADSDCIRTLLRLMKNVLRVADEIGEDETVERYLKFREKADKEE